METYRRQKTGCHIHPSASHRTPQKSPAQTLSVSSPQVVSSASQVSSKKAQTKQITCSVPTKHSRTSQSSPGCMQQSFAADIHPNIHMYRRNRCPKAAHTEYRSAGTAISPRENASYHTIPNPFSPPYACQHTIIPLFSILHSVFLCYFQFDRYPSLHSLLHSMLHRLLHNISDFFYGCILLRRRFPYADIAATVLPSSISPAAILSLNSSSV